MQLIYTSKDGSWLGVQERFTLDVSFGADDNDFELTLGLSDARKMTDAGFDCGCFIFVPNTEWGGVVDAKSVDYRKKEQVMTFSGRTWHGILASSIIKPDSGSSHLTLNGDANFIIQQIIRRQGLGKIFSVEWKKTVSTSYKFPRYIDAYKGIRKMLAAEGLKLKVTKGQNTCILGAVPVDDYSNGIDNNYFDLTIDKNNRPVNHLVCLGKGVGANRTVIDLYADEKGNISRKQTLFGVDEVSEIYNYNNVEEKELVERGTERLLDYQSQGSIDIEVSDNIDLSIGDILRGTSVDIPVSVETTISQVVVRLGFNKPVDISYKAGTEDTTDVYE